jgi:hypothetical protein
VLLFILGGAAAFSTLDRKVPVIELTLLGKTLVVMAGIAVAIVTLLVLSAFSRSGSAFQDWTYLRQTRHGKWLAQLFSSAALLGVGASMTAYALMGHVAQWLPAQEYRAVKARVLERSPSLEGGDLFNCSEQVVVVAENAEQHTLCLERGTWWGAVPERLKKMKSGDLVVVHLRRTALGTGAEISEVASSGQEYFVE